MTIRRRLGITQQQKKSKGYNQTQRECFENLEAMKLKINNRVVPFDMRKQITDLRQQLKAQREEAKESHSKSKRKGTSHAWYTGNNTGKQPGKHIGAIAASHQGVEQDKKELNLHMDVSHPDPEYSKPSTINNRSGPATSIQHDKTYEGFFWYRK